MLKFVDDKQFSVFGLDEILADIYAAGRKPNQETADEIIRRLEDMKNYIPESEEVRREYRYVLLKEYKAYIKEQSAVKDR
ncbi:MAG TPA: hypothetical protein DCR97_00485 [Deltaproteobacteria bacterium]|nr:hypothetical protein [Deltaproteobacteria bacterium]